jgi:hypothetical protein
MLGDGFEQVDFAGLEQVSHGVKVLMVEAPGPPKN